MTIRNKALTIIFSTTLILVLLLYGISETFLLSSFANLENHMVIQNLDRARLALSSDINQLNSTVNDWASWNDTYAFVTDRNQNYISANLNTSTLSNLRLNLILFINSSGKLVFAKMVNFDANREIPVPQNFLNDLFMKGDINCRNESDVFKGIVLLPEGSLLISAQPILTSEGKGPVKGTLIMGRYLDSELTQISNQIQLHLVTQRINASNMSSDFAAAQSSILKSNLVWVNPLSKNSTAGYALLKDIYGNPALILRVDLPRDIYSQGESTIYYFAIFILLVGFIFAVVILFLLDKTILSRVARLGLDIRNIALSEDFSTRIPVAGDDELSNLSNDINDMLLKIDQSINERRRAEDASRKDYQFNQEIISNANEGIVVYDHEYRYLVWNRFMENLTGIPASKAIGNSAFELFPHLVKEGVDTLLKRAMAGEIVTSNDTPYDVPDTNKSGWVLGTYGPHRGADGSIIGVIGIINDITERRTVEEALRQSEHLFSSLVQHSAIATFVINPEHKVINWNKACVELTGVRTDDIIGTSNHGLAFYSTHRSCLADIVIDNRTEKLDELYENHSKSKLIPNGLHAEGWYPNLGGKNRYILFDAAPIRGIDGKVAAAIETLQDITDRKRIEEALKVEKDRVEKYLNIAEVILVALDSQARITMINRRGHEILGYNEGELIGKDWIRTCLHPEDYERILDFNNKIMAGKIEPIEYYESHIFTKRGEKHNIAWHTAALKNDEGIIVGTLSSGEDITERKIVEEQKRKAEMGLREAHNELELRVKERTAELEARNAEMERFVYTLSHELRTPLISISGLLGLLKEDAEKGKMDRIAADYRLISDALIRMDQCLGETLELSRIGRIVNSPENVPFDSMVKIVLDQEAEKLKSKGVEVSVANDLPIVHVDQTRIVEVLLNLIENSIKYMGNQAHPKIEIGHRQDGEETIFFVKDNGIGIDPSQHEKVFSLFYRIDPKSEGTGVGLALVKRIIEVHGGRIWIESEIGKGCTVCFTLPPAELKQSDDK